MIKQIDMSLLAPHAWASLICDERHSSKT